MAAEAEAPLLTESPTISRTPPTEDHPTPESSSEAFPQENTLESPVDSSDPPAYSDIWTEALLTNPAALTAAAEDIPTYADVFPEAIISTEPDHIVDCDAGPEKTLHEDCKGYERKNTFFDLTGGIFSRNTVMTKKIMVTVTLMIATQSMFSTSMINSGFMAVHLTGRKISGTIYGLVGSGVGIGFIIAPFLGIFNRLHYDKGISHQHILIGIMVFNLAKCLCYGFADMISHKVIFAGVFILLRIVTGASVYMASFSVVHGIRTWFPDNFQLVNSLVTGTAAYVAYGTFSFAGAISYDDHGQHSPYLILGGFTLVALVLSAIILPRDDQPISTFRSLDDKPAAEQEEEEDGISEPFSPLIFLPIVGQFLINMTSGYCIITSIPFLMECCGVSSARASSLIFTNFLATAAGFLIAGIISQRQTLTANSQAVVGCCLVAIGTLFLFPSPSFPLLYTSSHYSGYVAISLLGLGDPLVTNVTISNMERIHTELCGRRLTALHRSSISSIWLIGWVGGINSGMFLAGIFLDHLTFLQGTCVVAGICFLATAIFGILKLAFALTQSKQSAERVEPTVDSVASCESEYV